MNAPATIPVSEIDRLLPQTQCGKCGHPGCRPYAEAIVAGEAINRCPPGGESTVAALAALTGQPALPLEVEAESPKAALIREAECIGCTKCLQACPVDAILGAAKQMHTVIEAECTGCELCVAPCPVDCIDIIPHPGWQACDSEHERDTWLARRAELGRRRFENRNVRLARQREEKDARRRERMRARRETAGNSQRVTTTSASSAPASGARARRAAISASVRRLEKRLVANPDDRDSQAALEHARQQLADIAAQRDSADEASSVGETQPSLNSLRIARSAARQTVVRAERQLSHAERRGSEADCAAAREQLERAEKTWREACDALEQAHR
ncbi:RnfABCDGE type electron transport complex subunit B [Kushneria aurantia]|uniref:RnfABCDGE type electron transport complex subunit B n=1 Tax=Kushneria aurantia TaxID=504092 RepID=A0ABV6G1P6_9GAMM|nr:RnfABCDGE type electron transport complex subunit B [Kushneria aurantia]